MGKRQISFAKLVLTVHKVLKMLFNATLNCLSQENITDKETEHAYHLGLQVFGVQIH